MTAITVLFCNRKLLNLFYLPTVLINKKQRFYSKIAYLRENNPFDDWNDTQSLTISSELIDHENVSSTSEKILNVLIK